MLEAATLGGGRKPTDLASEAEGTFPLVGAPEVSRLVRFKVRVRLRLRGKA